MSPSVQQARVTPVNDVNRSYSVAYLPKVEGVHKVRQQTVLQAITWPPVPLCLVLSCPSLPQVKVLFAGQDIDRSPFMVNVSKAMGDPSRVQARGPGLQLTGNVANKPTYFDIYTAGTWLQPDAAGQAVDRRCFSGSR